MERLRRTLLEIWIIPLLAAVVGFMGPFGTYLMGDFLTRMIRWEVLLMGAYILVRPTMFFWNWVATITRLPRGTDVFTAAQSRDLLAGGSGRAGPLIGSQTIYGVQPGDVTHHG